MTANKSAKCGFCGRKASEIEEDAKIISGQDENTGICSRCVKMCVELLEIRRDEKFSTQLKLPNLKPTEIKKHLDDYIIGQEQAKIILSVAVSDHYKRVRYNYKKSKKDKINLEKSNVLLIGPTGTGKTQFARTIAKYLGVPFAIGDATSLTEAGYVGDDVENLLLRLIQAADGDVEKAQNGILFIDEIDKLASTASSRSTSKDVGGEGVQQALLKLLEGTVSHVPAKGGRKHPEGNVIPFDTSNVLFIASGAFVGLKDVLEEKTNKAGKIGFDFSMEESSVFVANRLEPCDLVKFGLIPELVGRFPIVTQLEHLNKEALRKIFTEVKNSLCEQYEIQFKMDEVKLEFTEAAIDEIVNEALALETGARGLRAVAERMILPYKYRIEEYIEKGVCKVDGHLVDGFFEVLESEKEVG